MAILDANTIAVLGALLTAVIAGVLYTVLQFFAADPTLQKTVLTGKCSQQMHSSACVRDLRMVVRYRCDVLSGLLSRSVRMASSSYCLQQDHRRYRQPHC